MKLFCFPFGAPYFYQRPDTALMRPDEDFYIPPQCGALRYAPACLIRICKLGRSIAPAFASRYYDRFTLGLCLYDWTALEEARRLGQPWTPAVSMDYSLPSPRDFTPLTAPEHWDRAFCLQVCHQEAALHSLALRLPQPEHIAQKIAELSRYVYLKMGDLIAIELQAPLPVEAGHFFKLTDPEGNVWIDFQIK